MATALPEAVVALTAPDGAVGTGFFIAPELVLTCAHVVRAGDRVTAAMRGGGVDLELFADPRWYRSKGPDGDGPDLALLRAPKGLDHSVVCLAAEVVPGDELWSFGHPQGAYRAGESVSFRAEGPSLRASSAGETTVTLHHVTQGRAGPGFSGGPVLNWRTGAVCGVLRLAYGLQGGAPGARLITVQDIYSTYPFLERPEAVIGYRRPWLALLDDTQLRHGGWRYPGPVLRDYLKAIRAASDVHPYGFRLPRTSPPPLSDVYVSQGVTAHGELRGGPMPSAALLDAGVSALVTGGPGAGKSSLCRHLTARLAGRWLDDDDPPDVVPVLVSAPVLAAGRGDVFGRLSAAVRHNPRFLPHRSLPEAFFATAPLADTSWLVLVDGVDEVLDPAQREALLEMVAELWRPASGGPRILVLTRPLPSKELEPLLKQKTVFYRIEPFGPEALPGFAAGWFARLGRSDPGARAERFLAALHQRQTAELAGIPLLATMLVLLFDEDPERGLPYSRNELYERFVRHLLDVMYRRPDPALVQLQQRVAGWGGDARAAVDRLVVDARDLLEAVALERYTGSKTGAVDLAEARTAGVRPRNLDSEEWRGVLREVLASSGLMTEADGDLVFLHQTLLEFLAACGLARAAGPRTRRGREAVARAFAELDEDTTGASLPGRPVDHSHLRFLFAAWARQGDDAGDLVRELFNPSWKIPSEDEDDRFEERLDRGLRFLFRTLRRLRLVGPGAGAGLVSLLLFDGDAVPDRVLPEVVSRLSRAARRGGRSWAAEAIAAHDHALGVRMLAEMVCSRHLRPYRRLDAARALARWDRDEAVSGLTAVALSGPALPRRVVRWRETDGAQAYVYPVRTDALTAVGTRIAAVEVLAEIDPEQARRTLETMDEASQPGWHRLRIALALVRLEPAGGVLRFPEQAVGLTLEQALDPERVLALAGSRNRARDAALRLRAWVLDATAKGDERIAAALALTLLDRERGADLLAWLVREPTLLGDSQYTVDGIDETILGLMGDWRRPWNRRMPLLWDEDVAVAARHLAGIDRDLAVEALQNRVDSLTVATGDRALDALATLDRSAGAASLKSRLTPRLGLVLQPMGDLAPTVHALARIDPKGAEACLVQILHSAHGFGHERVQAAQLLAEISPQRAANEIALRLRLAPFDSYGVELARALAVLDPRQAAEELRAGLDGVHGPFQQQEMEVLRRELDSGPHA